DIFEADMIESLVQDSFLKPFEDPLETCLAQHGMDFDTDSPIHEVNALLDSTPVLETEKWKAKVEPLHPSETLPDSTVSNSEKAKESRLLNIL
ncbi:hypothetical protein PJI17_31680, partial [Mycobacterium kansasii]